ncbi:MAG TPA: hypothetical protein VFU22_30340 [Roseiflexaceae bacterium]|nr:hypothetical protein [Roseiflexaceae bacterium]
MVYESNIDNNRASTTDHPSTTAEQIAEIAGAVAELQAARVAEDVAARAATRRFRPFEVVMMVLLAISLLVHALTLSRLLSVRATLRDEVDQLAAAVQNAKQQQLRYDLPIDQHVPINVDVPIRRELEVPINTSVQIKQQISLPIDTGLGVIDIPVPIDANVPISTSVPIAFDQTVNISTTVPIQLNLPVQVDLGSGQVGAYLDRLYAALLELRERF